MLNPHALNALSDTAPRPDNDFPITWFAPELDATQWLRGFLLPDDRAQDKQKDYIEAARDFLQRGKYPYNIGNRNIRAAWEGKPELATDYPVAIHPTSIHTRITVQKGTLTIWGRDNRGLADMVAQDIIRRFVVQDGVIPSLADELTRLGITWSTLFPDLDNLARDLAMLH